MTIQQLQYIVAVNRHRHFVKAAEECGVSQPTLSAMIQKLEDELDVKIFDRNKHPVEPTSIGESIIAQAQTTINDMERVKEIVLSEIGTLSGNLTIGIVPTVAPYLVPDFIQIFRETYRNVNLIITEMRHEAVFRHLSDASIDMAIVTATEPHRDYLEIPLYTERYVAYMHTDCIHKNNQLEASSIPQENLWILQDEQCRLRGKIFDLYHSPAANHDYKAGSIDTLVHIVDKNGGYTLIPEMHVNYLSESQQLNVREIASKHLERTIMLIIRQDYLKERMLNAVTSTIMKIIPSEMLDERLKKFDVKLR